MTTSIDRFHQLLRIPTISSDGVANGSYDVAVNLLISWMSELGLTNIRRIEFMKGKPVVLGTIVGTDEALPSILLNGHYDVVPVDAAHWEYAPFEAFTSTDKRIYARGTQDMKCVLVQYLEALRNLKAQMGELKFLRTVHISFLPDEEVGGLDGAALFVQSPEFKQLNVGLALDEGLANPENAYSVFYGERASNWVIIKARGPAGHGSRFIKDTAIEKISRILNRIYSFRREEEHRCHMHNLKLGDVLSMNVTAMRAGVASSVLRGGFAINVIPTEAEIAIDIRVPLDIHNIEGVILNQWIADETDVDFEFVVKTHHPSSELLKCPPKEDKWVCGLIKGVEQFFNGIDSKNGQPRIDLQVFPAATDGRYIRQSGIPCIGFSPIRHTPILLHDHNEYIHSDVFLEGIGVYEKIIRSLANLVY